MRRSKAGTKITRVKCGMVNCYLTDGSIVLLCNSGKDVIAGDLIFNMLRPAEARIAQDYGTAGKSITELKRLNPQTVYPGHGNRLTRQSFFVN